MKILLHFEQNRGVIGGLGWRVGREKEGFIEKVAGTPLGRVQWFRGRKTSGILCSAGGLIPGVDMAS